ncbi:fibroblast growth factor receptor substrate 2 [Caerostris darwini]|uniref:Fibroblast growth factor receptor substrate 2 n=1 Tax=Caerostris darwini TaxID=1538125 RepID=A0AAV4X6X2_9ARAC|nr:fibroblast growth factor receptor substrate 2 [Caerostris darwini]
MLCDFVWCSKIMGCISSRIHSRILVEDSTRPVFHVWNIDEDGHYIKSCHIQVTDTDLVLHQRGEPPIIWPLQSLRRYGFDTELFSFECGHHCSTGPGIYAFKCKQAESLFNALQECLLVPRSDSEVISNGNNGDDTEPHSSLIADVDGSDPGNVFLLRGSDDKRDSAFEPQPGPSTIINGHPAMALVQTTVPTAPLATPSLPPTPKKKKKHSPLIDYLSDKSIVGLPPLGSFNSGKKYLPRCCMIGTCINASKQHYMNNKVLRKTTCGSCRTCSLNMCVVQTNARTVTYSDRAKQTDYGNVLDQGGHPRNCVHCCCDFKPTQKVGCSADDCPLHFNNGVDQITNYARLDRNNRQQLAEKATLRKEKLYQMQQPYSHVYTHIPTPVPKWPKTKSMSWRSLPHFGATSSLNRLVPKRSTSHFYANADVFKEKYPGTKSKSVVESGPQISDQKLDLNEKHDSDESLAILSSLSNSSKGSDPNMYAKINFEKTDALQNSANQTSFEDGIKQVLGSQVTSAGTQT